MDALEYTTSRWDAKSVAEWYDLPAPIIDWVGRHVTGARVGKDEFDRWRIEAFLKQNSFTTMKWAAIQFGLTRKSFEEVWRRGYILHPAIAQTATSTPPADALSSLNPVIEGDRRLLDGKLLEVWFYRLFMSISQGFQPPISNEILEAAHDILRRYFGPDAVEVAKCKTCQSEIAKSFCIVSGDPICFDHAYWLENDKPMSLSADLIGGHTLKAQPSLLVFLKPEHKAQAEADLSEEKHDV